MSVFLKVKIQKKEYVTNKLKQLQTADISYLSVRNMKQLLSLALCVSLLNPARSAATDSLFSSDTTHQPATFSLKSDETFNKKRFYAIAGSTTLALGGSYLYLKKTWWSEGKTSFHFDGGNRLIDMFHLRRDGKYAKNLDKAGHFYGGIISAGLLSKSLQWAGIITSLSQVVNLN
ncbi:MAG: hypothetical protein ACKO5C_06480 [Ferruginibacter sp.]